MGFCLQTEPKLSSVLLIGGVAEKPQRRACEEGVDIVVGTPGRLLCTLGQPCLALSCVSLEEGLRGSSSGSN